MLEEVRKCDIYGSQQDIKEMRVVIQICNDGEWKDVNTRTADLSTRARVRLSRLLDRAFNKPGARIAGFADEVEVWKSIK